MKQISIALTPDQLETLVLACGVAAKHCTPGTCSHVLEVRRHLINTQVVMQAIEDIEDAYSELHICAESGKVGD